MSWCGRREGRRFLVRECDFFLLSIIYIFFIIVLFSSPSFVSSKEISSTTTTTTISLPSSSAPSSTPSKASPPPSRISSRSPAASSSRSPPSRSTSTPSHSSFPSPTPSSLTAAALHFTQKEEDALFSSGTRPRTRVGCPIPSHVDSSSIFPFAQLGELCLKVGRLAEAISCWKKGRELDPEGNTFISTSYHYFQSFKAGEESVAQELLFLMRGLNRLFPEQDSFHQSRETILFRISPTSIEEEEAHLTSLIKELEIDVGLENAQSSQYFYILYSINRLLDLLSPLLNSRTNSLIPPPPPPPSSPSSPSPSPSPSPSFLTFLSTEQRRKAVLERRKILFKEAERVSSLVVERHTKSSEVFNVISLELSRILRKEGRLLESLRLIRFTFRNAILFALGNNTLESLRTVNGVRRGVDVTHYYQVASAESELAKALLKPSQYPFFNLQNNIENEEDKNYSYHSLFGEVEPEDFHPAMSEFELTKRKRLFVGVGLGPEGDENIRLAIKHLRRAVYLLEKSLQWEGEGIETYKRLALHYDETWEGLGNLTKHVGALEKVVELGPGDPHMQLLLSNSFVKLPLTTEVIQKAIVAAKKAQELAPTSSEALATYIFLQLFSTLWTEDDLSPLILRLELLMEKENTETTSATVVPMRGMVLLDLDKTAKGLMRRWSLRTLRDLTSLPFHNSPHLPLSSSILTRPPRLRIGYISGDLGVISPLPHLVADMFGLHDFSRFEVFVYCTKPNDGVVADWKDMKASILEPETHWRDLSALSERAAAETIFKDSIQVLIDLNGFTVGQRIDILAYHPVPLQATYLGWPGTMGAPFVDYVITDRVWNPPTPEVFEGFVEKLAYVETVAFMTSFQKRYMSTITAPAPKRGDYHLPESLISHPGESETETVGQSKREVESRETCFVFSNFNQAFKMDPSMFRRWMSILRRVPNSVLWLVMHTFDTTSSLRSKAKAQGVDPSRLIWAPFARNKTEYLYRSRLADLHLDNWIYNSGTTGADALWSGVPILTLYSIQEDKMSQKARGNSRASRRMASGLLGGVGLFKELVVRTEQEYEDRAVELALGYQREGEDSELGRIKKKLGSARLQPSTAPLFDTERQVREMERLVDKMWSRYARGLPPTHLLP